MRWLAARLALLPSTVLVVTLITFVLVQMAPGDPAALRGGTGVTDEAIVENRALAGLDRPLPERYLRWVSRSLRMDFGASLSDGRPTSARIAEALPNTLAIAVLALIFSFAVAVPLGTLSALGAVQGGEPRRARYIETAISFLYALPIPAIALLLLRAGAPYGGGPLAPALCLALPSTILLARHQRSALVAALDADYVRTARAKGASPMRLLFAHALRNASAPMATLLSVQAPALLSGSVLVERVFGVHGLGLLGYEAVLSRDEPMLMALTTLAALMAVVFVVAGDVLLVLLDPRLQGRDDSRSGPRTGVRRGEGA